MVQAKAKGRGKEYIRFKKQWEEGRGSLLQKTGHFEHLAQKLQHEGKTHFKKNLKAAHAITNLFYRKIKAYIQIEESTFFPFIEVRVPKLGLMIFHFRAEHECLTRALRRLLRLFRSLMGNRQHPKRIEIMKHIHQGGVYMIHLLRHHLKSEGEYLCDAAERDLHPEERKKMTSLLGYALENGNHKGS